MARAEPLTSLIPLLMAATCFEDAATGVLQAMLACAESALDAGPSAESGRLLRGMIHLRPADSYQRLYGVEHGSGARVEGTGYLTSANVWRWIAEHRCSVSIDVQRGSLRSWLPDGPLEQRDLSESGGLPGHESRARMLDRDATHVHVVPLRAPGGGVDGMIALEASCKAAMGQEPGWEGCHEQLEILASVGAPYLVALPLRPIQARADEFLPVVGRTTAALIELLRAFAEQEETVLISGPTGAGKSRLARWCHEQSQRKGQRFETLDLTSVPEDLQMAELFGWKRGAFTGAVKDNPGAVARAAKGTLFIDEIDKLSLRAQAGLLQVLESRCYRMLGDESPTERRAEVRFVIGTNGDLRAAVRAGRFREDLYYRINVLPVRLQPLSERLDEVPLWADYMLRRRCEESGSEAAAHVAPDAVKLLVSMAWPGNLRQLDNIIRRAYALAERGTAGRELTLERPHIERALAYEGGAEPSPLVAQLWRAAQSFAQEAEQREASGAPLPLDLTDAFRGMVLGAAVQRRGNRDDAFAMLGQQPMIKNRNHHRALRRELERVRELTRAIGGEMDEDLMAMLEAALEPADPR